MKTTTGYIEGTDQDYSIVEGNDAATETNRLKAEQIANEKRYSRVKKVPSLVEEPGFVPQTQQQIEDNLMKSAQGEINSLGEYYNGLLADQKVVNDKNDRSTSAVSTLTGLAGSSEADVEQKKTTAAGESANKSIKAEQQLAVSKILSSVKTAALNEARSQREEARLDESSRLASRKARQEEASTQLTNLSASGVTFEGLKKGDKQSFDYLVKQYGSESALKGAFLLNTPQDQIIDKKLENGKYIVARQNPITGKITVDTMDTGIPVGYSKTIDAGNRILAIPDDWDGDVSKLKTISKGLTPDQQSKAGGGNAGLDGFPSDIQAAAQSILDGKSKLNEYPSAKRLQINAAMSKVYQAEGGNELAQGAYDSAAALKDMAGFKGAIGAKGFSSFFGLKGKPLDGSAAAGYLAELDKLKANLKLVNIKYLKGTGALSDAEGKTLEDASTSLNPQIGEAAFTKELERVTAALAKAKGVNTTGPQGKILVSPDGQQMDASALTPDEYAEAIKDGYKSQ